MGMQFGIKYSKWSLIQLLWCVKIYHNWFMGMITGIVAYGMGNKLNNT